MTPDSLESLLRKAQRAHPPAALKSLVLQRATRPDPQDRRPTVVPYRSSPPWAWSLIAAGWILILSLWSTTPIPLPQSKPDLPLSFSTRPNAGDRLVPYSLHADLLDLLPELGLARDSAESFPLLRQLRSEL